MTKNELFAALAIGELASLSGSENGTITAAKQPSVLAHANTAMTVLHTRFCLRKQTVTVSLNNGTQYDLPTDCLKVLAVRSLGVPCPLNLPTNLKSVFTPAQGKLVVPTSMVSGSVDIEYQANHEKLTDAGTEDIVIPVSLEPALLSYIAYKAFSSVSTQEALMIAQAHLTMHEGHCAAVTISDTAEGTETGSDSQFTERGWV